MYYCYQVENTGNVPFDYHDLVDTQLGTILDGSALRPGSRRTPSAGDCVGNAFPATTVNTATWTAYTTVGGPATSATDTCGWWW